MGDFQLALGIDEVSALLNVLSVTGNAQCKPGYQTASVRVDRPNDPAAFSAGSYTSTTGTVSVRQTLTPTDLWIRFGVVYGNSSGDAAGFLQVTTQFDVEQRARVVGQREVVVNPSITTTDLSYFPLTDFVPAVGASGVMAGFVVQDNESTYLEYQLFCRSANDTELPNAWTACEASYSNPAAGNSSRNSGALSIPAGVNVSTHHSLQFALGVRKKSGAAGNPRAQIRCFVALNYA
jgi:hypothetical protein